MILTLFFFRSPRFSLILSLRAILLKKCSAANFYLGYLFYEINQQINKYKFRFKGKSKVKKAKTADLVEMFNFERVFPARNQFFSRKGQPFSFVFNIFVCLKYAINFLH